jgi:CO/xanthine dehydrogenase FAD-binding subunit
VRRAPAAEKALVGSASCVSTIAAAVKAILDDVRPGELPDAEFLRGAAQGLLFQALASILKQVT